MRAVDGGFELDGHGTFRHVLVAPGHPGLNVPDELRDDPRVVHSYEPHEYASTRHRRRRRARRRDRVAERARRRRRGRLGPAPRAACAGRSTFRASTSRAAGSRGFHRLGAGERAARLRVLLAPSYPPGRQLDEPLARADAEGRFRVEASLNGSRAGDLRDRLRARLPGTTRCWRASSTSTSSRRADDWVVLAPDGDVPALTDETRTLALAGVSAQWAFPAADTLVGREVRRRTASSRGSGDVVHAERTHRVAPRRAAARRRGGVRARARGAPLVAGRGGGLMVGVGLALDVQVYDRLLAISPAGRRCRSALLELGAPHRAHARSPGSRRRLAGGGALRRRLAARAAARPRRLPARCGSATRRTAASSAGSARVAALAVGVVLAGAGATAYALRRPSCTSRPACTRGRS